MDITVENMLKINQINGSLLIINYYHYDWLAFRGRVKGRFTWRISHRDESHPGTSFILIRWFRCCCLHGFVPGWVHPPGWFYLWNVIPVIKHDAELHWCKQSSQDESHLAQIQPQPIKPNFSFKILGNLSSFEYFSLLILRSLTSTSHQSGLNFILGGMKFVSGDITFVPGSQSEATFVKDDFSSREDTHPRTKII